MQDDKDGRPGRATGGRQGGHQPRRVTPDHLERAALHYLERHASSAANLRRLLLRRVQRSAQIHGTDLDEGRRWVDALVDRLCRSGLLDDRAYAEMKVNSLHRRGGSTRRIRQTLSAKGVDADLVDHALADLEQETGARADLAAAVAYARRRRLGPFRPAEARADRRDRDLAALARAGFSHDVARRVIGAEDPDTLWDD